MPASIKRPTSKKHASVLQQSLKKRNQQLKDAVEYCRKNKCKGQKAISAGVCPQIKDPRTINKRLKQSPKKEYRFYDQDHSR